MKSILDHEGVRIAGAQHLRRTPAGVLPERLPEWALHQIHDPLFRYITRLASGVRLAFASDTSALELDAMARGIEWVGLPAPVPRFDLIVDGEVIATQQSPEGERWILQTAAAGATPPPPELRPGAPACLRFDGLGGAMKRIELWLPQNCSVELRDLRADDGARVEPAPVAGRRWIHYGSSISQCSEADGPTQTWPATAARLAGVDLTSFGFGGQCHLDQSVARTIRDLPADVISLKVGINVVNGDTMRERVFVSALHGFLDTVRDGHPGTPLLVVTPILYPAGEDHPGPSIVRDGSSAVVDRPDDLAYGALSISRIRALIAEVIERRRSDDANLHLLDGRLLFGEADLADLPDGLHPNTAGYVRMGERFAALAFGEGAPLAAPTGVRA